MRGGENLSLPSFYAQQYITFSRQSKLRFYLISIAILIIFSLCAKKLSRLSRRTKKCNHIKIILQLIVPEKRL